MKAKWLASVLALACLCVFATTVLAEEAKKAEAPPPMQPAKPGPEHAIFAKDVGRWKAISKMMMDPTKPAEITEGTEECTLICNGLFLRSDYHIKDPKGDFYGSGVLGYDAKKSKYTGVWVDNYDTALYPYEGTCDASGKCVFDMQAIGPKGEPMTFKMIWEHVDDDHRKFSMQMPGPDGTMFTCMEVDYIRM